MTGRTRDLVLDAARPRCRRCAHGVVGADQRCATCGAWWEPVTLLPGPESFDSPELRAAIARPIPGEHR